MKKAIGSSYFMQQWPGAEDFGGLEVVVSSAKLPTGQITIENTTWPNNEIRPDVDSYSSAAVNGINDYVRANQIDISKFDITLRRFILHDVNSNPKTYFLTAQIALDSAMKTWHRIA